MRGATSDWLTTPPPWRSDRRANGETYELLIVRKGHGPKFATQMEGSVDFGNGPVRSWILCMRIDGSNKALHMARLTRAEMAQARNARTLRFQAKKTVDAVLQLANMPAVMNRLQACTADLMAYWNHGGEPDGRIAQSAKADMGSLFRAKDFPQEAMDRRQEGAGQFLLLVDEQGKIAGCHLVMTSGIPAFDAPGMPSPARVAKFKPALDITGKPVRSAVTSPPIKWVIH